MTLKEFEDTKEGRRFFVKVKKTINCWIWIAGKCDGYGAFMDGETHKSNRAHRVIMKRLFGDKPFNKEVCHKCNNKACVNPDHLYYGTRKDNVKDQINAGVHNLVNKPRMSGQNHINAILTDEDVIQMRELNKKFGWGPVKLSEELGFNKNTINNILYGNRFKYLRKEG